MVSVTLVAVYGTLKRGLENHPVLCHCSHVGNDILETITLYDTGPWPAARTEPSQGILVEVYEIDAVTLQNLDELEDFDESDYDNSLYIRQSVQTAFGPAWLYLYNRDVTGLPRLAKGSWYPKN